LLQCQVTLMIRFTSGGTQETSPSRSRISVRSNVDGGDTDSRVEYRTVGYM